MVFAQDGTVRAAFGGPGADLNTLGQPNGLAADLTGGAIVITDGGNNRVLAFPEVKE
jgi:hypothetical protein